VAKTVGDWRWPPTPHLTPRLKEKYSPSGPSCPVLRWTLPLHL